MPSKALLPVSLICCSLLVACVGQGEPDVCTLAEEHVAQCSGAVSPVGSAESCSGSAAQLARQVLNTSCETLNNSGGKSDALSNSTSLAVCVALGIPLFITESPEGGLCCFSHNCQDGQDLTCRQHRCTKRSAEGGPCDRKGHCVDELRCIANSCRPPLQLNESCGPSDCADNLVCGSAGTCQAPGGANAACADNFECDDSCIKGACTTRSDKGGPCDPGDAMDCGPNLSCDPAGTCQDKPAESDGDVTCDPEALFQCEFGETCWEGSCEPQHEQGQPCGGIFDCQYGLGCVDNVCSDQ